MAFIRVQKLKTDESGKILSGSASVIETIYVKGGKYHSRQQVREPLGKVLWLSESKRSGIFQSPTRGLVEYSADEDAFTAIEANDERLQESAVIKPPAAHTVFGDVNWILTFLEKCGLLKILETAFPNKSLRQRMLCHLLHSLLKDGSRVPCDNFIAKSFASYLVPELTVSSLRSDTLYFQQMGADAHRLAFFKAFVGAMRKTDPEFGTACYVDSTPLPNDIADNPFNALCSHGVSNTSVQSRLVMLLDQKTGLPVWYSVIPGNVLDLSTVRTISEDAAASVGVKVDSMVLDAGYVSRELIQDIHKSTNLKTFIARMPAKKGYPFKDLYTHHVKPFISRGKYCFVRKRHIYFGKRVEIDLFGGKLFAYVYVDKNNALQRMANWINEHPDEFDAMRDYEKDWLSVKFGYFVLLSNEQKEPNELLDAYFCRLDIEQVFKTAKDHLELLPLSKWSVETIQGKLLHDIIATIALLQLRKKVAPTGLSISDIVSKLQSLMCFRDTNNCVRVETPNKQVKAHYALLGVKVPASVDPEVTRGKLGFTPNNNM